MTLLFIVLCCVYVGTFGQDFEVRLTHSAINKLVQYAIPHVTEHIESQRIPSQTIEGVLDLTIGTISVRSFTFNLTFIFHTDTQQIEAQITDLSLEFRPFRFSAEKQATEQLGLSCHTVLTPSFMDWNFAFKLNTFVDDECTINLAVDESSIVIDAGTVNVDAQFLSTFCDSVVSTATYILDLETNIEKQIVEKMPEIIINDLQSALDDALQQMRYIKDIDIGLCYTEISITDVRFAIGGMVVTDLEEFIDWQIENATDTLNVVHLDREIAEFTQSELMSVDGTSVDLLAILFVVFVIVAIGIGIGISYAICGCIYRKPFQMLADHDTEDVSANQNEQQPMIHDTSVVA
eukprot:264265_1